MTQVCRPTPTVRFMPMSELALKAIHGLHGTTDAHGNIFTGFPYAREHTETLFRCKRAKELRLSSF